MAGPASSDSVSPPSGAGRPRGAFRPGRAECVFLSGVVLLVLSIVLPAWVAVHQRQRLAMARSDLASLLEAGTRYFHEYGAWPTEHSGEPGDFRYGRSVPNAGVLNVLRSVDGPGNVGYGVNEQKMVFIEVEPYRPGWSGLDTRGEFLDPWGSPYEMVFDTDFNNVCVIPDSIYGRLIGEGMVVWSCGPDRKSDTPDDILSWKRR